MASPAADGKMGAMARLHDVVFDSRHPASIARFWAAVLDGYAVAPYDEAELARLRGMGILDPEDDPNVRHLPAYEGMFSACRSVQDALSDYVLVDSRAAGRADPFLRQVWSCTMITTPSSFMRSTARPL